jgi:hypothetical protein
LRFAENMPYTGGLADQQPAGLRKNRKAVEQIKQKPSA